MFFDNNTKRILDYNVQTIINVANKNGKIADDQSVDDAGDTYQLALKYSKQFHNNCVVTSDITLIERIKLNKLKINIYDLNEDKLITHNQFSIGLKTNISCTPETYRHISGVEKGVQLKDGFGNTYTLSDRVHTGGEGRIYKVESEPEKVAKIYFSYQSSDKAKHLKELISLSKMVKIDWCVFPETILYLNGEVVGFLMQNRKFDAMSTAPLYQGDNNRLKANELKKPKSYNYMFASTFLAQLKFLSAYGISVCDYGKSNFSQFVENRPVIFVDTDSFLYKDYMELALCDNMIFSGKYTSAKEDIFRLCDEGAYQHVFKICTLGLDAIWKDGYVFNLEGHPDIYRRAYLNSRMYNHFYSVFCENGYKSLSSLLSETAEEFKSLIKFPHKNISIEEMVKNNAPKDNTPAAVSQTTVTNTTTTGVVNTNSVTDTNIPERNSGYVDVKLKKGTQSKPKSNNVYWWIGIATVASAAALLLGLFTDLFSSL